MRKITETEYQMGEKEFKEKLGLEGNLSFIIIKTSSMKNHSQIVTINMKTLKVEK